MISGNETSMLEVPLFYIDTERLTLLFKSIAELIVDLAVDITLGMNIQNTKQGNQFLKVFTKAYKSVEKDPVVSRRTTL